MALDQTRETIVRLLENVGGRKEVAEYLRHYTSVEEQRFAIVTFARDVDVGERVDEVAAALSFLHQVGLQPIVALTGQDAGLALTDALEARTCRARPIVSLDEALITSALRAMSLPIIAMKDGLLDAVRELADTFQPHKIILLDNDGGILAKSGERIDAINLAEDEQSLATRLDPAQYDRLQRFIPLIEHLPHYVSLSVTSPQHLARELFTHRGAGTLVRRGERVEVHETFAAIDADRMAALIASCFGRSLVPDYFEQKRCRQVYVTERYRGTAILTEQSGPIPYLDKFAVTKKARGEGLGASLWRRLRADHPALFWRARTDNPVNGWYFQQSDGTHRTDEWTVFWYGLSGFAQVEQCVNEALGLPATLVAHA